jgi:hypothetical protein
MYSSQAAAGLRPGIVVRITTAKIEMASPAYAFKVSVANYKIWLIPSPHARYCCPSRSVQISEVFEIIDGVLSRSVFDDWVHREDSS